MPARYRLLPRQMPRHPRRVRRTQGTDAGGVQAVRSNKTSDYPCCCCRPFILLAHCSHRCNVTLTQKPRNTARDTGNGPPWGRRQTSPARQPGHQKGAGRRVLTPTRQTHGGGTSPAGSDTHGHPDQARASSSCQEIMRGGCQASRYETRTKGKEQGWQKS